MKLTIVLLDVRSVHNVGSIFRTADAAGAEKIYCCGITPTPLDRFKKVRPDFAKVSLGAENYVAWEFAKNATDVLRELKEDRWTILAVEQSPQSVPYYKTESWSGKKGKRERKIVVVVGNEVRGVPPAILKTADAIIEIPMSGKKESLNVAVAFGIVAFRIRFP